MTATLPKSARHVPFRRARPDPPVVRRAAEYGRLVGIVAVAVVFTAPLVWMVLAAFKTNVQIGNPAEAIVFRPTLRNFGTVFEQGVFLPAMWNSLVVGVVSPRCRLCLRCRRPGRSAVPMQRFGNWVLIAGSSRRCRCWCRGTTCSPAGARRRLHRAGAQPHVSCPCR